MCGAEAERSYCDVLCCSAKQRLSKPAMLELSAGVTLVDIEDPSGSWAIEADARGRNVDHFGILTDGFEGRPMCDWLATNGIKIEEVRDEEEEFSFYVRDPAGNLVELLKRRS